MNGSKIRLALRIETACYVKTWKIIDGKPGRQIKDRPLGEQGSSHVIKDRLAWHWSDTWPIRDTAFLFNSPAGCFGWYLTWKFKSLWCDGATLLNEFYYVISSYANKNVQFRWWNFMENQPEQQDVICEFVMTNQKSRCVWRPSSCHSAAI